MLFIKGIYLLLSHLPTSHTTVRAVPHTAVSCFLISRCVASCFQPSLRDTSLLFDCRIPSYRVNREFLFGHLTTKDSQGSSHLLLHCTIQSFLIDNPVSWVLCPLPTSHDKLYSVMVHRMIHLHPCVRETSLVKHAVFPSYTHLIYYLQFRVVIGL